jgi:tagatose 6-phosphate kinase
MILCLGTTPAVQRVMRFQTVTLNAVNRAVTTLEGAAGKSINVAKVLHALGQHPIAVSFLGGDRGAFLRTTLAAEGIEAEFVEVKSRTRECVTVIDQASGAVTELVEESGPATGAEFEALLAVVRRRLSQCRAAVMSGTIAPGGRGDFYRQVVQLANAAGALSVVDAQGTALKEALEAKPGLVKPNLAELTATMGRRLKEERAVIEAMFELRDRGAGRVVVTAGKEPTLACEGDRVWRISIPPVAVVNPIGSGDAFTAGLVWRLVRGDDLGQACRWANAAGAANALTLMAGTVSREDVERLAEAVVVEQL